MRANRLFSSFLAVTTLLIAIVITTQRSQAITNGGYASEGQFPFVVQTSLYSEGGFRCAGALIAPDWVLTADHCFWNYGVGDMYVTVGPHATYPGNEANSARQNIPVAARYRYAGLADGTGTDWTHDLMLLRLEYPAQLNNRVQTIGYNGDSAFGHSGFATMAGWGRECAGCDFPQSLKYLGRTIQGQRDSTFIDLSNYDGQAVCDNDSGSPAFKDGVLIGIMVDGDCNNLNLAMDVAAHADWIESVTGIQPVRGKSQPVPAQPTPTPIPQPTATPRPLPQPTAVPSPVIQPPAAQPINNGLAVTLRSSRYDVGQAGGYVAFSVTATNNTGEWVIVNRVQDSLIGDIALREWDDAPESAEWQTDCDKALRALGPGQSVECHFNAYVVGQTTRTVTVYVNDFRNNNYAGDNRTTVFTTPPYGVASTDWWAETASWTLPFHTKQIDMNGNGSVETTGILIGDWNMDGICQAYEVWWTKDCIGLSTQDATRILRSQSSDMRVVLLRELLATWLNVSAENDHTCVEDAINLSLSWLHNRAPSGNPLWGGSAISEGNGDWVNFNWSVEHFNRYSITGGDCAIISGN